MNCFKGVRLAYIRFGGPFKPYCSNGLVCLHAESLQLCLTLCNLMDCSLPGFSVHVGCHFLLQGIFRTQGLNSRLSHLPALAGVFFSPSTTIHFKSNASIRGTVSALCSTPSHQHPALQGQWLPTVSAISPSICLHILKSRTTAILKMSGLFFGHATYLMGA